MLTRLRDEGGFTVVELLAAMAIMVIILGATLTALDTSARTTQATAAQNDAQDALHTAVDGISRELRSAASPGLQATPVVRAQGNDLVFLAVDPVAAGSGSNPAGLRRVRLCLDDTQPDRARLVRQVQSWSTATPPALPGASGCPDSAYGASTVLVDRLVNDSGGRSRPVFSYDSADPASVQTVNLELFGDADTATGPGESRLATAIFLRNENRTPTADFAASDQGNRHLLLNGSPSVDPDGDTLTYDWYSGGTRIGGGPLLDWTAPAAGSYSISLTVTDPSGLTQTAGPRTVPVA
jgi:type II secretory pathway pseudopilin PulG